MSCRISTLADLGWSPSVEEGSPALLPEGTEPARVAAASRERYRLLTPAGAFAGELAGRLRYSAESALDLPAVGDWVAAQLWPDAGAAATGSEATRGTAVIAAVLPRRTRLVRKSAGSGSDAQLLAANVDVAFLVSSLNRDLNLRRLERFRALVESGGARPVYLLTKADLVSSPETALAAVAEVAGEAPVHVLSALGGSGLEAIELHLPRGRTAVLLGSSGVGKSTLINRLAGSELRRVREIRTGDDRGRHATTERQLIVLPWGGLVIDTPGLREVGLWADAEPDAVFDDVVALAERCRFADCRHADEPGCRVRQAVEEGELDRARVEAFEKLRREASFVAARAESSAAYVEKMRWKTVSSQLKRSKKDGGYRFR